MARVGKLLRGALTAVASTGLATSAAQSQTVIDEWASAKFPPPPQLKAVKIEPRETALLVMDFTNQTCSQQRRPRCVASIPKTVKLVTEARAKGVTIIYSVAVAGSVAADIVKELTPAAGETVLPPLGPDKFIGSELEKTLKDRGIKTVIAMGTQAQTLVLHTGGAAALRGDRAGGRHVGRRRVSRGLHGLASRHRGTHRQPGDADVIRADQLLTARRSRETMRLP